jgi:hypothetical protein
MEKLFRITPLEKKSIEYFVDVFERLPNGTIRGFDVTETWRWGVGFKEEDDPVMKYEADIERMHGVHCNPQIGWGCELDDLIAVHVQFSDGFTKEEQEEIEAILRGEREDDEGRWGTAWIYDGDHNWEVEDDHVRILPPFKVDLVDANGYGDSAVVQENVELE